MNSRLREIVIGALLTIGGYEIYDNIKSPKIVGIPQPGATVNAFITGTNWGPGSICSLNMAIPAEEYESGHPERLTSVVSEPMQNCIPISKQGNVVPVVRTGKQRSGFEEVKITGPAWWMPSKSR